MRALSALHAAPRSGETIEDIRLTYDTNRDGIIDFDEFAAAACRPSPVEEWCKQVPWWRPIADAIPPPTADHAGSPLQPVALLTDAQIDVICAEALASIALELRTLRTRARQLDKANSRQGSGGAKFATFKANVGNSDDFHNGLSDRVGACASIRQH